MNTEMINYYKAESKRVYNFLKNEFYSRFKWINACPNEEEQNTELATILMDDYISPQVINAISKDRLSIIELSAFFEFIENLLVEGDAYIKDVLCTTLIEKLASEQDLKLERILPYCGLMTKTAIYDSLTSFYGKNERVLELKTTFSK